mgnify:CR=1 FL=1
MAVNIFQSTLPTRGSDEAPEGVKNAERISIHAPHEGERPHRYYDGASPYVFQSTLPTRGSDRYAGQYRPAGQDFNPRSPRGGATMTRQSVSDWTGGFQSTLPTRGSDCNCSALYFSFCAISIHAPHEGERRYPARRGGGTRYFNPRSPRGGATSGVVLPLVTDALFQSTLPTRGSDLYIMSHVVTKSKFQSTLPTRGSDMMGGGGGGEARISIHAPHEGERRHPTAGLSTSYKFQSTLPTRGSDSR